MPNVRKDKRFFFFLFLRSSSKCLVAASTILGDPGRKGHSKGSAVCAVDVSWMSMSSDVMVSGRAPRRSVTMRVRLDYLDHILAQPGPLDNSGLSKVPVIRVFGSSFLGLRCCLHIHQVYPYFYIDYLGSLNPDNVRNYIHKLRRSLNHAVALSLRRNPDGPNAKYIHAIILVKGVPFYGFHSAYQPYLKVMVSDPTHVFRIVTILQSGGVMGTKFTTYENHLSYYLQFMCDFGLYGCGWIDIDGEILSRESDSRGDGAMYLDDSPFLSSPYYRQTRLPLELDICSHQIRNRDAIELRDVHSTLQIPSTPPSSQHLVHSVRELWEDERRRRAENGLPASPDMPTVLSGSRRGKGGDWVDLNRLENLLDKQCESEKRTGKAYLPRSGAWEKSVLNTFESTEALWDPSKRRRTIPVNEEEQRYDNNWSVMAIEEIPDTEPEEIHVDEKLVSNRDMEEAIVNEEVSVFQDPEPIEGDDEEGDDTDHQRDLEHDLGNTPDNNENNQPDAEEDVFLAKDDSNVASFGSSSRDGLCRTSSWKPANSELKESYIKNDSGSSGNGLQNFNGLLVNSSFSQLSFTASMHHTSRTKAFVYAFIPPTSSFLRNSFVAHGLPNKEYRDPFYSSSQDLPKRPREYAGQVFDLTRGVGMASLPPWDANSGYEITKQESIKTYYGWEYAGWPPSKRSVKLWLQQLQASGKPAYAVDGNPTQGSSLNGSTQQISTENIREKQNMTVLAMEVFAKTSHGSVPDPNTDELVAILYSYQSGNADISTMSGIRRGVLLTIQEEQWTSDLMGGLADIETFANELDLINGIIDLVANLDPDILVGWEIQSASWGYLQARGKEFGLDISDSLGRGPTKSMDSGFDEWGRRTTSTFKVVGRHVLNVWRLMRSELSLTSYTFENVCFHLLHRRVPKYTQATLTQWVSDTVPSRITRVLRHLLNRTSMTLEILDKADVITKTAEFARVFGIDFFSVISRGSQFKVESFVFRIAKPENFVLISPNKSDVGKQNAAECMPLIMEPYSAFYKGPVVVLDFQSLYPSIMIAYNYCYSTCLGRIQNFKGKNKFGVTHLNNPPGLLSHLRDYLNISPNGMVFVKPQVRQGLLGRMLTELLDTRVMVKQAMKTAGGDKTLLRVLEARQLGLKYIANVTYGYTSATFSGRMPAVEIADAIVQSGRETLEKAIDLIESAEKWNARVVYGDTDSLFIYLDGRTKDEAFVLGNEIADAITALNPAPIKLKFEKVYLPCVLMAKKRYVGFKYERPDDSTPKFDAKGIETVRRDGTPGQQKLVERCLKILFRTRDLSAVKKYCQTYWQDILDDAVSIQDFIFSKEVKLGTYSDKGPPPPGAVVAGRRALIDPNDEPQYGERVPYVILRGEPGMRLVERAVSPEGVLNASNKHIDAEYYISRVLIPPLERIFNLMGADVRSWYSSLIKSVIADNTEAVFMSPSKADQGGNDDVLNEQEKASIDSYYRSTRCIICKARTEDVICLTCKDNPDELAYAVLCRMHDVHERLRKAHSICVSCALTPPQETIMCESLDCPWLFVRKRAANDMDNLDGLRNLVEATEVA